MKTVTINEELYELDSLSEEAKQIINDITVIDSELERYQRQAGIAVIAKSSLSEKLEKMMVDFKKVQ